jgi:preprotein translocase subunit SecG
MLTLLLIILDILVCVALIGVVLMQRSEGGAFGMSGGPTGLITARGAGDLLTRTTWILFAAFLAISLSLTLLGAHDRATSSIVEKLKLQRANPNELNQPATPAAPTPAAPGATPGGPSPSGPTPGQLLAPQPQASQAPLTAPAPATVPSLAPQPVARPQAERAPPKPAASREPPPPPVLEAPAPKPAPASPAPTTPGGSAPSP